MFGGGVSEAGMDAPSFELFNLETDLCCGRLSSCRRRSLFLCCASLFCSKPFLIAFSIVSFSSPKTCAQHSVTMEIRYQNIFSKNYNFFNLDEILSVLFLLS
uniref:(northern house mosquito) hypothetical protein n=1 Tax=Culex pipiens TaxID=7175 RepID=A0A8D8BFL5_CULPI